MILIDFSGLAYQDMYSSISAVKPRLINDKYCTEDFAPYMIYRILEDIFEIQTKFCEYGDVVICLDGDGSKNWRKNLYPMYKSSRPKERKQSNINFNEVFGVLTNLIYILQTASPYKVVRIAEAEGDDVIMALAKEANEEVMIVSADKDMIQMQQKPNVKQYSYMTQKFVTYEDKGEDTMEDWLLEHVVLGDATDDVPRVVDGLKFTEAFKQFMKMHNLNLTEEQVRNSDWSQYGFDEYRPGVMQMLNIFEKPRFGISTAKKTIKSFGSLDAWLDSDHRLRDNYNLNKALVLESGIPDDIRKNIIDSWCNAQTDVDINKFNEFLEAYGISPLSLPLPSNFNKKFTIEDLF